MSVIPGVVIGLVTDVADPRGEGRIQLRFPWMSEGQPLSAWARIAAPMAGPERGIQFMPEVDDEVLVAFDHGDVRFPYVIGYLWNGQDKPPRSEPTKRVIQTVKGHLLEFDDTDGSEKISLLYQGDLPSITLEQSAINIKLSDSNLISITDSGLTVQFDGSTSIVLDSSGVTVQGAQINLNA